MKRYFTQYIISADVPGKGDLVMDMNHGKLIGILEEIRDLPWGHTHDVRITIDNPLVRAGEIHQANSQYLIKLDGLFVFDRNFIVGDEVYHPFNKYKNPTVVKEILDGDNIYFADPDRPALAAHRRTCGKRVGIVSPEAEWIEPNMEFDEDDLRITYYVNVTKTSRNSIKSKPIIFKTYPDKALIYDRAEYWAEHEDGAGHAHGYSWDSDDVVHVYNVEFRCPFSKKCFH